MSMQDVMSAQALFGNEFAKEFMTRQKAKAEGTYKPISRLDFDAKDRPIKRCRNCDTRITQPILERHCPACGLDGCYDCFARPIYTTMGSVKDYLYVCPQCDKEIKAEKPSSTKQDAPKSTQAAPVSTKTPAARVTRQSRTFVDPDPDMRF